MSRLCAALTVLLCASCVTVIREEDYERVAVPCYLTVEHGPNEERLLLLVPKQGDWVKHPEPGDSGSLIYLRGQFRGVLAGVESEATDGTR